MKGTYTYSHLRLSHVVSLTLFLLYTKEMVKFQTPWQPPPYLQKEEVESLSHSARLFLVGVTPMLYLPEHPPQPRQQPTAPPVLHLNHPMQTDLLHSWLSQREVVDPTAAGGMQPRLLSTGTQRQTVWFTECGPSTLNRTKFSHYATMEHYF